MQIPSDSFTDTDRAFLFIESFTNLEKSTAGYKEEYKLDRIKSMTKYFGDPQKSFRSIHIAGSKGKGSTAAATAAIIEKHGYKTGMFTSPHLISYKERITLAGRFFPDEVYLRGIDAIKKALEERDFTDGKGDPTTFELLTLLSFLIFKNEKCEFAVIETGMGGRLDATNIITPEISIITPVEKEHCEVLGNTLEKIAYEKSGIIKEGIPVISQRQRPEAYKVIAAKAASTRSKFIYLDDAVEISDIGVCKSGTFFTASFKGEGKRIYSTNLTGVFQCENICASLLAAKKILPDFDPDKACGALSSVKLEGRLEILRTSPPVIIDGSHTEYSMMKFTESYIRIFCIKGILIFGSVKNKNFKAMLDILSKYFNTIIISRPGTFKESSPEEIYGYAVKKFPELNMIFEKDPIKAMEKALKISEKKLPIIVTGSFYLAGEIKKHILKGEIDGISV